MHEPLLLDLARWVNERTLAGTSEGEVLSGMCERLVASGMPLLRAQMGADTLHPLVGGKIFRWWRGRGLEASAYERQEIPAGAAMWRNSPYHHLIETGGSLYRFRYPPANGVYPFPVLEELVAHGITDYVACVHQLGETVKMGEFDCVFSSWSADGQEGFTDAHVALLDALVPFLASAVMTAATRQITRTLVETYLGRDAGERVLRGAIERGIAERIRAVIWFSDLKGFTSMVDSIDPSLVVPLLNDYADAQVAAIHAHGGTVLKFIGDGLLAIFPVGENAAEACGRALAAAEEAFAALATLSARRADSALPATDAYLALHVGEVFYGNIGGAERLDFTVIGPAVNEAARISAMCRPLGQDIVVSQAFAEAARDARTGLLSLGSHTLRGVARPQALFSVQVRRTG
ncbi:adenylate/guanylate cyclase domain-containing protein [Polyangium aurulentum]|uniref:adenylate/guanylate cyclase domain-containing protein n=1 Tax=Polyangium aurulentum TaxID=2567896 RepID=UPI00146CB7DB|nr:adenylate/guanylate cyclase domain-containing protein [Polyangium aurulentum]UQA62234.1 adenylate/guanylate cyclase domain-containing protein [Polyangium aurulentum]